MSLEWAGLKRWLLRRAQNVLGTCGADIYGHPAQGAHQVSLSLLAFSDDVHRMAMRPMR